MMNPQKVLHLYLEEEKKNPKLQHEYIVSEKLDGWFTTFAYSMEYGWHLPLSSAGREIPAFSHMLEHIEKLPTPKTSGMFIAEAYMPGVPFHTQNGIYNRSKGNYQATDVQFYIHDFVETGTYSPTIIDKRDALTRYRALNSICLPSEGGKLNLHKIIEVTNDKDRWYEHFADIVSQDGEGVVLKQASGIYQPDKRNSSLMKIKLEDTFDLHCIEMYNTVGDKGNSNLNLMLIDSFGTKVPVRIGKHEDVTSFRANSSLILDKVVEIKCMKKNKDGSYREPRFKCIREDKTLREID